MRYATEMLLAALALVGFCTIAVAAEDDANTLRIYKDQSKVLKLDRPALRVIIGNAEVADVAVPDLNTVVVTGKNYGTTNLVILDGEGHALLDERVLVSIDEDNTVRLYQSTQRTVLSCTPACETHKASR